MRGVRFLLVERFAQGSELVFFGLVIVVEECLVEVFAQCVDFHLEFDHVGGVVCFKGDYKNRLTIRFDEFL